MADEHLSKDDLMAQIDAVLSKPMGNCRATSGDGEDRTWCVLPTHGPDTPHKWETAWFTPALPAELSGKGEQRRPTIEELEAILREPDGTYEVHILPNGEVHSRRILKAVEPEPGEAKKEET